MPFVKQTHCKQGHLYTDDNVYVATHKSDGRQYRQCRECTNAGNRAAYHALTPEQRAERNKNFPSRKLGKHYQRKQKYGLTKDQVVSILEYQGGVCGICGKALDLDATERKNSVNLDHDHATGENRAILCSACNFGLGNFGDDSRVLRNALAYLLMNESGTTREGSALAQKEGDALSRVC